MSSPQSIGSGHTYSTVQNWIDGFPGAGTGIWPGEQYTSGGEFTTTAANVFHGVTSATDYFLLTTATGQSFIDNAGVQTNPLAYDVSKGVGNRKTNNYGSVFEADCDWVYLSKIQIKSADSSCFVESGGIFRSIDRVIVESNIAIAYSSATAALTNSLCIVLGNNYLWDPGYGAAVTAVNCTFVSPANVSNSNQCIHVQSGTVSLINCAVFGFASVVTSGTGATVTGDYNATDCSSFPGSGTHNLVSKLFTNQFVGINTTGRDFRPKTGNDLALHGVDDYTDIPLGIDIVGTPRPSGSWAIGCWQPAAAGGLSVNLSGLYCTAVAGSVVGKDQLTISSVNATAAIGNMAGGVKPAMTGVFGTGAAGAFAGSVKPVLTGVTSTAQPGSFAANENIGFLGVNGTGAVGSIVGKDGVNPNGVSASAFLGAFGFTESTGLTGVSAQCLPGTITASLLSGVPLSGVWGTAITGSVVESGAVPMSGVAAAAAAGTMSINEGAGLGGVFGTGTVGNLTPGGTVLTNLSGVFSTAQPGAFSDTESVGFAGAAASGLVGSFIGAVNRAMSGVAATASVNLLVAADAASVFGVSSAGQVGIFGLSEFTSPGMVGISSTAVPGNFGLPANDSVGMTGVFASAVCAGYQIVIGGYASVVAYPRIVGVFPNQKIIYGRFGAHHVHGKVFS